jgi:hypothetical protein
MGGALMNELFNAGFENTVDGTRWQLKWQNYAGIEEWANAESTFWDAPIESACTSGSSAPERVVLMVFSWSVTTEEDWTSKLTQTVENFVAKYPALVRLDLMTQVTGPANMLCPTPPAEGETIVVSAELAAALETIVSDFPGFVFSSPQREAQSCADFDGGGPHLTSAGNMLAVGPIATYFAATQ